MKKLIFILIILVIFITSCNTKSIVEDECINLCSEELNKGTSLENGPCLSNNIAEGWVCDVVHSPRQDVDNLEENQCSAFKAGQADHFVEVTPDCKFIRKV